MTTQPRLTQRELARKLGVSQATVSRALAHHSRHSEETRLRVRQTAGTLGYRPDPVLASLNAYRRTRRPITRGQSLAWFGATPPDEASYETILFKAARRRAEALGYGLDYFREHTPDTTLERFEAIFAARGIAGVIFGPRPLPHARVELNIESLAAVAMGRSVQWPPVDLVSTDHFQTMEICFGRLHELGYRRIGFVLTRAYNARVAGIWNGSYFNQQRSRPGANVLPPFQGDDFADGRFDAWWRSRRPDAVITMAGPVGCLGELRKRKLSPPRDLGVALLVVPEPAPASARHAGIVEPVDQLAHLAVDVLVARIRNNERGIPAERRVHLLPGAWRDGASVRR